MSNFAETTPATAGLEVISQAKGSPDIERGVKGKDTATDADVLAKVLEKL
jgi:hypothetical protein